MRLKIIHPSFEINLVDTSFTMVKENFWFSDDSFAKYTFPITKELTDQEAAALGYLNRVTARGFQTVYDVRFYIEDKEHEAVMEIEKITGRKVEFQIRYGFEDFPNFHKKLSELPLHNFELEGEDIYEHAEDLLDKQYPETDYNFPRVFTDMDLESPQWEFFEGSINNWDGTKFIKNVYDDHDDVSQNKNIMQPMPHLLYVFKTGFAERGYDLQGEILDDPEFQKAYLATLSKYYSTVNEYPRQELTIKYDEHDGQRPTGEWHFQKSITVSGRGRYRIAGNLYLQPTSSQNHLFPWALATLRVNGYTIGSWIAIINEEYFFIDLDVRMMGGPDFEIEFEALAHNYRTIGGTKVYDADMLDLSVSLINEIDNQGNILPNVVTTNEINLPECVPDITFGDLWKAIKTWKRYDISIDEDVVYINKVKSQIGKGVPVDLSKLEVMEPEREPNQNRSFELKFPDIDHEEYEFLPIYMDRTGAYTRDYVKKDDTQEIIIEALPLPLKEESGIITAHDFLQDESRLQIVLYDGLQDGKNTTLDPALLFIPAIFENEYREWFEFLMQTFLYRWTFNQYAVLLTRLHERSTVYAYGAHHVVKQLSQKNQGGGIFETEIETYSLE